MNIAGISAWGTVDRLSHEQWSKLVTINADIDWQDQVIHDRADAIVNRTAPDPYLWGRRS
jgi:hypothetical protein